MHVFQVHVALLGRISFQFCVGLLPVWVAKGFLVRPGRILVVAVVWGGTPVLLDWGVGGYKGVP